MLHKAFRSNGNPEIRFMGVFRESPPFHFYLMQFVGFSYFLYRFASRNYTVYGFLPPDMFNYPRISTFGMWPIPLSYFTSFQFIYTVIPRPTPEIIFGLQWIIIISCCLGLFGLFPKWNALVSFLFGLHLTGLMQASNAELDGGTLALSLMFILALSPAKNFYGFKNGFLLTKRSIDYHWPIFLLFLLVGSFYTGSGMKKIIDIGPHWPFVLHLENLAAVGIERSLFLSSRFVNPFLASLQLSYFLSIFAGLITLVGELFFISVLFLPRYRYFFVFSMIALHILVFVMAGINFIGNSLILLLCLDWNIIIRKADVYYRDDGSFCSRLLPWVKRFDWFRQINLIPVSDLKLTEPKIDFKILKPGMGLRDENGELYYGIDALEQFSARCPLLFPFNVLMKLPGIIYIARYIHNVTLINKSLLDAKVGG
jgi:hypothetical protein